jgi:hypothetical protein
VKFKDQTPFELVATEYRSLAFCVLTIVTVAESRTADVFRSFTFPEMVILSAKEIAVIKKFSRRIANDFIGL